MSTTILTTLGILILGILIGGSTVYVSQQQALTPTVGPILQDPAGSIIPSSLPVQNSTSLNSTRKSSHCLPAQSEGLPDLPTGSQWCLIPGAPTCEGPWCGDYWMNKETIASSTSFYNCNLGVGEIKCSPMTRQQAQEL